MPYRRCVAGMLLLGALAIRTPVALCQAPNNATLRVDRPVRQLNFLDEDNLACMLAGCRLQEWSIKEGKKKSGFAPALVSPPCFVHQKERDVFLIPHLSGALFEVKNGKLMKEHGERQPVATNSICVSRSGRLLAMGQREFKGDKYRVLILDTRTWEPIKALYGHDGNIASLSFSPDEKTLASTGWDDRLIVWDLERFKERKRITLRGPEVGTTGFSPTGTILAYCKGGETVLLSTTDFTRLYAWGEPHGGGEFAFSNDGKLIALAGHNLNKFVTTVWDIERIDRVRQVKTLAGHTGVVRGIGFSPKGTRLATGGDDKTIKVWEPR